MQNMDKVMKHFMVFMAVGVILVGAVNAQNSITISGTILPHSSLTVTPQPGYTSLNLTNGAVDTVVAIVTERSNYKSGYTIDLESANARASGAAQAFLKGASAGNNSQVQYVIKYNDKTVHFDANGKATAIMDATTKTSGTGVQRSLKIAPVRATDALADTYSDTLILTITGKS